MAPTHVCEAEDAHAGLLAEVWAEVEVGREVRLRLDGRAEAEAARRNDALRPLLDAHDEAVSEPAQTTQLV